MHVAGRSALLHHLQITPVQSLSCCLQFTPNASSNFSSIAASRNMTRRSTHCTGRQLQSYCTKGALILRIFYIICTGGTFFKKNVEMQTSPPCKDIHRIYYSKSKKKKNFWRWTPCQYFHYCYRLLAFWEMDTS